MCKITKKNTISCHFERNEVKSRPELAKAFAMANKSFFQNLFKRFLHYASFHYATVEMTK